MTNIDNTKIVVGGVVLILIILGYMAWLDRGCEHTGVMTAHGKTCVEDL